MLCLCFATARRLHVASHCYAEQNQKEFVGTWVCLHAHREARPALCSLFLSLATAWHSSICTHRYCPGTLSLYGLFRFGRPGVNKEIGLWAFLWPIAFVARCSHGRTLFPPRQKDGGFRRMVSSGWGGGCKPVGIVLFGDPTSPALPTRCVALASDREFPSSLSAFVSE